MEEIKTPETKEETNVTEKKPARTKKTQKNEENRTSAKKTRKPRARKVEDLVNEATKKMTDKEKDLLISFLREDTTKLKNTIEALKQNIESAYSQCRELEKQYESMENFYRESLKYIDGQVIAFANAVRKSTVGGMN